MSNLCFGGANQEMLFITAGPSIYGITRRPDLVVTSIQRIPNSPAAGLSTTFSVVVKNQGTGPTPAGVATRVALSIGTLTNWVWADGYTDPIPPDSSVVLECDAGVSGGAWIARPGTNALRAVADDLRRFTESNVSNNTFTASLVIAPPPIDTDGDGVADADEIVAGTDPQSAASLLRILATRPLGDGGLALTWTSVAAKTYRVACKSRLNDPAWTDLADVIPSQGEATTWTNRPAGAGSVFLRVRVGP